MGLIDDLWSRVNQVQTVVSNVVSYAYSVVEPVVSGFTSSFGGAGGFGGGGAGGSPQPGSGSGGSGPGGSQNAVVSYIGDSIGTTGTTVTNLINQTKVIYEQNTPDIYQRILGETINSITNTLTNQVQTIWRGIMELKDSIISAVNAAWDAAYKTIKSALDVAITTISAGVESIVEQSRQIYFTIRQYIDGLMSSLNQGIKDLTGTITESIAAMQADLKVMLKAVEVLSSPEKFGDFLTKAILASWQSEV